MLLLTPSFAGEFSTLRSAIDGDEEHDQNIGDSVTDYYVGKGTIWAKNCVLWTVYL